MNPARSQSATGAAEFVRRFVVLEHDFPFLHWDYLIEDGETLACWRLAEQPGSEITTLATRLDNHRRHYLTYEGPVSGDRGHVHQINAGQLKLEQDWPSSEHWHDVRLTIIDSNLAASCILTKRDDQDVWSFN